MTATRYYTFAGSTVAVRTNDGQLALMLGDEQGSTSVMMPVTVTASGGLESATLADAAAVTRTAYTPYGELRGGDNVAVDRGWLGQVEDRVSDDGASGTGLTYLNARYYDPALGRFLSPDPLMNPGDPRTLDAYVYSSNNPVLYTDASGLRQDVGGTVASNDKYYSDPVNKKVDPNTGVKRKSGGRSGGGTGSSGGNSTQTQQQITSALQAGQSLVAPNGKTCDNMGCASPFMDAPFCKSAMTLGQGCWSPTLGAAPPCTADMGGLCASSYRPMTPTEQGVALIVIGAVIVILCAPAAAACGVAAGAGTGASTVRVVTTETVGDAVATRSLPPLTGTMAESFADGVYTTTTVPAGTTLYRVSSWAEQTPGHFFGVEAVGTAAEAESAYYLRAWGNPTQVMRTYVTTEDVTVYYGSVARGEGYQIVAPQGVTPASVVRQVGARPLP
jgi:RHS repeat-associated protein